MAMQSVALAEEPTVEYIENGRGLVPLYLPSTYDDSEPLPLIVGLHGYSQTAENLEYYFNLVQQIEERQFLYCVPQGTTDDGGYPFWNATDACCNFYGSNVDDSAYLRELIELIRSQYAVDDLSIHVTGLSNGGFMSYRMACDHADLIASVAPLAGVTYQVASACTPSEPVHVLHVHGIADQVIYYNGGCIGVVCYPGAVASVFTWLGYNDCDAKGEGGGPAFDLDGYVPGDETTSRIYEQNCDTGVTVELWSLAGSGHVPGFVINGEGPDDNRFAPRVVDWLLAHRKSPPCTGDVDGDGHVDGVDLSQLLGHWSQDVAKYDLDENGNVDGGDLSILLGYWGDCE